MKPILFNTDMARAILDGRKTETRRVIKPQPKSKLCYTFTGSHKEIIGKWSYPSNWAHEYWGEEYKLPDNLTEKEKGMLWTPPYHTDDILYVRETFCIGKIDAGEMPDGREELYISQCVGENDFIPKEYAIRNGIGIDDVAWKPSIHMPKEAARIFLRVTNVRVERLQEITIEGCEKEGVFCGHNGDIFAFMDLWNSTIKKSDLETYGWGANPWVYVIAFERITKEEAMKG